ncbi:MAG TPA: response regulator, partial [Saprospiraceae bacterium]|nr:response regulator [Saprospiraceae bacterium]
MPHNSTLHKVLLIDDNAADARLVSNYLDQTTLIKTKLIHVTNLKDASDQIAKETFSVIILDLSLKDSQGINTLQRLRNLFPKQILNIIVLTGNIENSIGIEAIRQGAQDFLIKSNLDPDILGKAIRFSIERHQTYRYLNETQRQAKIGSWRYRPSTDEFFASDLVYEILGSENTHSEYLSDAIEKSGSSFLIFVHYLEEEKEYPNLHRDSIAKKQNGNVIHIIIKSERTVSLDNQIQINGTIQDITHRVRMEELSKEAEFNKKSLEVKEQFIANVSHEMRTPMNAILGLSRL